MLIYAEGPISDLINLHEELHRHAFAHHLLIPPLTEEHEDFFDFGQFGGAPITEFAIGVSSGITTAAATASAKYVREKAKKWRRIKIRVTWESPDGGGSEEAADESSGRSQ